MSGILTELNNLVELQKLDTVIGGLISKIEDIPKEIEKISERIKALKAILDAEKGTIQKLHIELRNKNLELETVEQAIKKHTTELNLVKTNQAYRALLDEIEAAKKLKSEIEDFIIGILEKTDAETKKIGEKSEELKKHEVDAQDRIKSLNSDAVKMKEELDSLQMRRQDCASKISSNYVSGYEQLRSKKNSVAVVPVEGRGCGGCHMNLSYQNLNELYRLYHEESNTSNLVKCENCSRILYLPEGLPKI